MGLSLLPFHEWSSLPTHLKALIYLGKKEKVQEMGTPLVIA